MQVAPPEQHFARHARLREALGTAALDGLVVTSLPNIDYLTGLFASTATLVVGRESMVLLVDGRYTGPAGARQSELVGLDVHTVAATSTFEEAAAAAANSIAPGRIGFEAAHLTVRRFEDLAGRGLRSSLVATQGLIEGHRMVKDAWEAGRLRDAAGRLSDAAKCIIPKALAGMREREIAGLVEAELRRVGFDKPAFDTIVASGPNSAFPHHRTGDRRLESGDLVVLDFGGMLDGYAVDLTRTVTVGPAAGKARGLLEVVVAAQAAAFEAIQHGRPATDIDGAARQVLEQAGLGEAFSHGTGHGLGLEVHEGPRLGRVRPELPVEPLLEGMVFTLEPGAYIPDWGGVRIEDDVAVTACGAEWLTDVPRLM